MREVPKYAQVKYRNTDPVSFASQYASGRHLNDMLLESGYANSSMAILYVVSTSTERSYRLRHSCKTKVVAARNKSMVRSCPLSASVWKMACMKGT